MPGMSRFHLAIVAQRFLGWVAAVIFALLAAVKVATWKNGAEFPTHAALALYVTVIVILFTPRLVGLLHALLSGAARYGGNRAVIFGEITELCFSLILIPISMFAAACFVVRLILGWGTKWEAPPRSSYSLRLHSALTRLWGHTLFAAALIVLLLWVAPGALSWFAPFWFGLLVAIPFALLTSSATVTDCTRRMKLCASPEDLNMPIEVAMARSQQA
jgi:membrane glycosyltransferase